MRQIIVQLHKILNMVKGFTAAYGSDTVGQGKMIIDYEGRRFSLTLKEIENPSVDICDDISQLKWHPGTTRQMNGVYMIPTETRNQCRCYFCGETRSVKYLVEIMDPTIDSKPTKVCCCNKCILTMR